MTTDWQNKVALITGASAGLGLAMAEAFGEAGLRLALAARNEERLEAAAERLRQRGFEAIALAADVTSTEQVERAVEQAAAHFGRLDVLVNNAGVSGRAKVMDVSPEQFREMLDVNFLSVVRCTRAAAPHLIRSGGNIVNIGSLAAKSAAKFLGAYPASKFPVAAYSQQLRYELEPEGVHVLLVCPGPIARDDAGVRYTKQAADLPESARRPGGGVKLKGIDPHQLARRILQSCERRRPELVIPAKARVLFTLSQLSPRLGDWIVEKMT